MVYPAKQLASALAYDKANERNSAQPFQGMTLLRDKIDRNDELKQALIDARSALDRAIALL